MAKGVKNTFWNLNSGVPYPAIRVIAEHAVWPLSPSFNALSMVGVMPGLNAPDIFYKTPGAL